MDEVLDDQNPLVSIVVITYNSSKYVLETLESAKDQTYQNIELIISDDFSIDETVPICKKWVNENGGRFTATTIIAPESNTGTAANCNRGVRESKGTWIKLIAGDDILHENLIQSSMEFSLENVNAKLILSKVFGFTGSKTNIVARWPIKAIPGDIKQQLRSVLKGGAIKSPGVMIKTELILQLDGFNERFPFMEDDSFWVKCLQANERFYLNKDSLVFYRLHDSVSNSKKINPQFFESLKRFKFEIVFPLMRKERMYTSLFLMKARLKILEYFITHQSINPVFRFFLFQILRIVVKAKKILD